MAVVFAAPQRTSTPRVSVVIPVLNDARHVAALLPALPPVHEVILVDGGSVDDTLATARRVLPDVVTVLQDRVGKGSALSAGLARVTGDVVVLLEADVPAAQLSIARLVRALTDGADAAVPVRFAPVTRCGALWADLVPCLDLPLPGVPSGANTRRRWGDGVEVDVLMRCRLAAAGALVVTVPSSLADARRVRLGHPRAAWALLLEGGRALATTDAAHRPRHRERPARSRRRTAAA